MPEVARELDQQHQDAADSDAQGGAVDAKAALQAEDGTDDADVVGRVHGGGDAEDMPSPEGGHHVAAQAEKYHGERRRPHAPSRQLRHGEAGCQRLHQPRRREHDRHRAQEQGRRDGNQGATDELPEAALLLELAREQRHEQQEHRSFHDQGDGGLRNRPRDQEGVGLARGAEVAGDDQVSGETEHRPDRGDPCHQDGRPQHSLALLHGHRADVAALLPLTAAAPEAHQITQPSSTAVSTVVAPPTRSP